MLKKAEPIVHLMLAADSHLITLSAPICADQDLAVCVAGRLQELLQPILGSRGLGSLEPEH